MTNITPKQDIDIKKVVYDNVLDFIEDFEDYYFGKILEENKNEETCDISIFKKIYL